MAVFVTIVGVTVTPTVFVTDGTEVDVSVGAFVGVSVAGISVGVLVGVAVAVGQGGMLIDFAFESDCSTRMVLTPARMLEMSSGP